MVNKYFRINSKDTRTNTTSAGRSGSTMWAGAHCTSPKLNGRDSKRICGVKLLQMENKTRVGKFVPEEHKHVKTFTFLGYDSNQTVGMAECGANRCRSVSGSRSNSCQSASLKCSSSQRPGVIAEIFQALQ
jgi:hypothetical protein